MKRILLVSICASVALISPAQQANSSAGSMVINGIGGAPTPGPFNVTTLPPSTVTITMSGPLFTPFTIVNANPAGGGMIVSPGTPTPFGIVDIGPIAMPPIEIVIDGISNAGNWIGAIAQTGSSGSVSFPVSLTAPIACGATIANVQGIFPNPATGFALTAAFRIGHPTPLTPDPAPVTVPTGDDTTHNYQFVACNSFPFYGVWYSSYNINSNGNITFVNGDWVYVESQSGFDTGSPRIAATWDDLYPTMAGMVTKYDDGSSVTVAWNSVPEFSAGGSNSFSIVLNYATGEITFTYGTCSLPDCITGITPGGSLGTPVTVFGAGSAVGRILDRTVGSLGPYSGGPLESLNEVFTAGAAAFNLVGTSVHFAPDPTYTAYLMY